MKTVSIRQSIQLTTLLCLMLLINACQSEVVELENEVVVTQVVEVEKEVEVIVEKEVEVVVLPDVDPLNVSGNLIIAGSSTVFPLAERMAERFEQEGYSGKMTIDSIGSGGGFERFCEAGESDISNASRAIKDSERESCLAIDRDPIEFRIGTDAVSYTHLTLPTNREV